MSPDLHSIFVEIHRSRRFYGIRGLKRLKSFDDGQANEELEYRYDVSKMKKNGSRCFEIRLPSLSSPRRECDHGDWNESK
jgi:hypothetical protein